MKHLLNGISNYLETRKERKRMKSNTSKGMHSSSPLALHLSDKNGKSTSGKHNKNVFCDSHTSFLIDRAIQQLPEDTQAASNATEHGPILAVQENIKSILQKIIDTGRMQHEDMKRNFEAKLMDIGKDIDVKLKFQQDEIRERFAKTDQIINEIRKTEKL